MNKFRARHEINESFKRTERNRKGEFIARNDLTCRVNSSSSSFISTSQIKESRYFYTYKIRDILKVILVSTIREHGVNTIPRALISKHKIKTQDNTYESYVCTYYYDLMLRNCYLRVNQLQINRPDCIILTNKLPSNGLPATVLRVEDRSTVISNFPIKRINY